jgi:hypothetical protein
MKDAGGQRGFSFGPGENFMEMKFLALRFNTLNLVIYESVY